MNNKTHAEGGDQNGSRETERQGNKAVNDVADQTAARPAGDNAARKGEGSELDPTAKARPGK